MTDLWRELDEAIDLLEALDEQLPAIDEMTEEERREYEAAVDAVGAVLRALGVYEEVER